jgi:hypothetical protein
MNMKKILGFAAVGALLIVAAPAQQAQAASPVNPGVATTTQSDAGKLTTEVRWHRSHWRHRHWHPRRHWHHRRHWR